jgi:zinc protease
LQKLTRADVNRVIRKHLRPDRLQYVVVTDDAARFQEKLLGSAPTPITYTSKPDAEILAEDKIIESLKIALDPKDIRVLPIEEVFRR